MDRIKTKIAVLLNKGWTIEDILEAINKGINILEEENSLSAEYERKHIRDTFFKNLLNKKDKNNVQNTRT